jgi:hypothetical protein
MEDIRKKENSKSLMEKIGSFYLYFSNKSYLAISFSSSAFLSYKYLKKQEIYEEFHGHYNSPKYYQNKNLRFFHLQEALVRFCFGGGIIFGFLFLTKHFLISQEVKAKENNNTLIEDLKVR